MDSGENGGGGDMNLSKLGLDCIIELSLDYVEKFAKALDSNNIVVKQQVFELLSALCLYNERGYKTAFKTLEYHQNLKNNRYRFEMLINELINNNDNYNYQSTILSFINCAIISNPQLIERNRLRNEFIGLNFLTILKNLKHCKNAELRSQIKIFKEHQDNDEAQSNQLNIDLNSHLDIFYAILKQISDTPQNQQFLLVLQHLLRIDSKEPISDIIWDVVERLVHRATLIENRDDATRLLRTPSTQSKTSFCHCQRETPPSRKQSLIPPPPPPAPILPFTPLPPPMPMNFPPFPLLVTSPEFSVTDSNSAEKKNNLSGSSKKIETINTFESQEINNSKLPQQDTPMPKTKMKTINWNKIPNNKVVGKNNIWNLVADKHQHSQEMNLDWNEVEDLFCLQTQPISSTNTSPSLGGRQTSQEIEKRVRKENLEIQLLDGKRSLNVNIFLKQFKSSNENIIEMIKNGNHDDIGGEKLRGLLKILPEVDELDMLKSFNGDYNKLGNAEKFLLQLIQIQNYKLRIESMLLKEEFVSNMSYLEPCINAMLIAAQDLTTNSALQEVLYFILVTGNFLNSGGYAGNAAGVKLTSLQKVIEIRSNKPNMTLVHFVAMQIAKKNKSLLSFPDEIRCLEEASKTTVEQLNNEIHALSARIEKIKKQIEMPNTDDDIKIQMMDFLILAEKEMKTLERDMNELENVRKHLAEYFCEDLNTFKMEECFRIFLNFCTKFKQAIVDNNRRRRQEEQANIRRKQREELIAYKKRQLSNQNLLNDSNYHSEDNFQNRKIPKIINDACSNLTSEDDSTSISGSPCISRRFLGSINNESNYERSPDVTPNGSIRRRKSRNLQEEHEGELINFLRASGEWDSKDKSGSKSWAGSLDRSWARKLRNNGTVPKKRPALLGIDLTGERERSASPSPSLISEATLKASNTPPELTYEQQKTKHWRQKIENWLSNQNNNEQKLGIKPNRNSLEIDSESEKSSVLDTVHEGESSSSQYSRTFKNWKPSITIKNTDVIGCLETVQGAQDKKINKNEEQILRENYNPEIQSRKELISSLGKRDAQDRLLLYIRRPSDLRKNTIENEYSEPQTNDCNRLKSKKENESRNRVEKENEFKRKNDLQKLKENELIQIQKEYKACEKENLDSKVEIDADNIETPPFARRNFIESKSAKNILPIDDMDLNSQLGNGQFDRFSSTRKTRRYKKSSADNSGNEGSEYDNNFVHKKYDNEKDFRLKQWQDRLKSHGETMNIQNPPKKYSETARISERFFANSTKDKTVEIKDQIDEGFEETPNLMSESTSEGGLSSLTTETNSKASETSAKLSDISSKQLETKSGENTTKDNTSKNLELVKTLRKPPDVKKFIPNVKSRLPMNRLNIPRQMSISRLTVDNLSRASDNRSSKLRANSTSRAVEKSNSKASLFSSHSSLNSSTSTNTIKRSPLKTSYQRNDSRKKLISETKKTSTLLLPTLKQKPPSNSLITRNTPPTFMKPTASSSTKSHPLITKSTIIPTYRSAIFK